MCANTVILLYQYSGLILKLHEYLDFPIMERIMNKATFPVSLAYSLVPSLPTSCNMCSWVNVYMCVVAQCGHKA